MNMSRRELLWGGAAVGAIAASGVLVPLGFVLTDDDEVPPGVVGARLASFPAVQVGRLSDLEVGNPIFFDYPLVGQSNIAVRMGEPVLGGVGPDRDVVAFSNLCTHMGCPITDYRHEQRVLGPCPCHYTTFDLSRDGVAALGQATQNLPRVLLQVDDDDLTATGVYRLVYGHDDTLGGLDVVAVGGSS